MNNRFGMRRSGNEQDRYESERGNARSDRERYEFSDRDESGYRGWAGGEHDEHDERHLDREGWGGGMSQSDDRDRWGMRGESQAFGQHDIGRDQMREGRAGYGVSTANRNDVGHWARGREGHASDDYRGQGFADINRDGGIGTDRHVGGRDWQGQGRGGQMGGSIGYGAQAERRDDLGHRGYGGSMGGRRGGYGQRDMAYGGMNSGDMQRGWGDENRGTQGPSRMPGMQGMQGAGEQSMTPQFQAQRQGMLGPISAGMKPDEHRRFRGPKGYKRSDERVREDVCDQLGHAEGIDVSDIEVSVSNGEVTFSGTVPERRMKYVVEHIAERVSGVNDVHNQLRVKREEQQQPQATGQNKAQAQQAQSINTSGGSMSPPGGENGRRGTMSR